jgi:hypothetical protein
VETLLSMAKGQQTLAACYYDPNVLTNTLGVGPEWPTNFMEIESGLGNVFLSSSDGDATPANVGLPCDGSNFVGSYYNPFRVYSTMDTNTGVISVWLLNLTNSGSQTVDLHFPAGISSGTLSTLVYRNGTNSFFNQGYFGSNELYWSNSVISWASGNSVVLTNAAATAMLGRFILSSTPARPAAPVISGIPSLGQPGEIITITGNHFSTNLLQNTVYFGPVRGTVVAATPATLSVQVPYGAGYAPVSVTVSNLTAYSMTYFSPAYYGASVTNLISFQSAATNTFVFSNNLTNVAFADLSEMTFFDADGDGKGDLAFVGTLGITGIFENTSTGPGSVEFSGTPYSMPVGDTPGGTTYGDLDGDGLLDWVVTVNNDWSMEIFRNQSTPGNIFFGEGNLYRTGRNPVEVKVMDFDGDGRPDIVVANQEDNTVSVYRNLSTGPGNFTFAQKVDFPACSNAQCLAVGDFDGDGKPDIAVVGNSAGTSGASNVVVLRNISTPGNTFLNTSQY